MYWNVYKDIQIGNENLRFSVGILNPLSSWSVIINISAISIYYENMNKYT